MPQPTTRPSPALAVAARQVIRGGISFQRRRFHGIHLAALTATEYTARRLRRAGRTVATSGAPATDAGSPSARGTRLRPWACTGFRHVPGEPTVQPIADATPDQGSPDQQTSSAAARTDPPTAGECPRPGRPARSATRSGVLARHATEWQVGIHRYRLAGVQRGDRVDLRVGEGEVEDPQVLGDPCG